MWSHSMSVGIADICCTDAARNLCGSFGTHRFRRRGIIDMQTAIAASFAATVHGCPAWLKVAARAAFLLVFLKSAVWLAASWLTFRGFAGL